MDIVVLNRSERQPPPTDIEQRLEATYPGCDVVVRRHPSFLSKRKERGLRRSYLRHKFLEVLDFATLRAFTIINENENPWTFNRTVRQHVETGNYDAIFCNYVKMSGRFLNSFKGTKIVDTHDLQYIRIDNEMAAKKIPAPIRRLRVKFFKWSEKRALRRFNVLLAISRSEIDTIQKLVGKSRDVRYFPATFEASAYRLPPLRTSCDLLFVGSNSDANRDGLIWFIDHVFPAILKARPETTLLVAGRIGQNKIAAAKMDAHPSSVRRIGFVKTLDDLYSQARVVVCPILYGTGMKIKAVEALAFSSAIVGTNVAFDSIDVKDGQDAFVADDVADFAKKTLQLLTDEKLRTSMTRNAYGVSKRDHTFETAITMLGHDYL